MTGPVSSRSKVRMSQNEAPSAAGRLLPMGGRMPEFTLSGHLAAPWAWLAVSNASCNVGPCRGGSEKGADHAHGLQARLGVDLVLAHDHGLAAEALDDRADIGADQRAGQEHRLITG